MMMSTLRAMIVGTACFPFKVAELKGTFSRDGKNVRLE